MLRKEFIQMRRDRLTLAMMIVIPAVQIAMFGYAIRTEVRHLKTVVLDESRTSESRAFIDVLRNTGNFDIEAPVSSRADLTDRIQHGAQAAIAIPPEYMRDIKRGRPAQIQVIVDAADPLSSSAAISGATLAGAARAQALANALPSSAKRGGLEVRIRPLYNPSLKSSTFIVPGIVGVLLALTMILITSMAVVRERERGTLEQLVVTPITKSSLMVGKLLPFVLVGYVQMSVVLILGRLLFDIPLRGSVPLLYLLTAPYIIANLALGLFVSTLAKTQAQAMQISFFLILPNILLSGFMFPREAMPAVARGLGTVIPLTYYLQVLRGILLKDFGFAALWPSALVLTVFAGVFLTLSVVRFSKTMG